MTARLHATTVAFRVETGLKAGHWVAVLLEGPSGSGKSDLALRLIDRGARLVADDVTDVALENGRLIARPVPGFAGLLEIRGIGIVTLPYESSAEIVASIALLPGERDPERLPGPETREIHGISLPHWRLDAEAPSAAARVRIIVGLATEALQRYVD